jgi:hypothetical protein
MRVAQDAVNRAGTFAYHTEPTSFALDGGRSFAPLAPRTVYPGARLTQSIEAARNEFEAGIQTRAW